MSYDVCNETPKTLIEAKQLKEAILSEYVDNIISFIPDVEVYSIPIYTWELDKCIEILSAIPKYETKTEELIKYRNKILEIESQFPGIVD